MGEGGGYRGESVPNAPRVGALPLSRVRLQRARRSDVCARQVQFSALLEKYREDGCGGTVMI